VSSAVQDVIMTATTFPPSPPNSPPPILLHGMQRIHKFNRRVPDDVMIQMALYRVEGKAIDVVLSANIPLRTADGRGMEPAEVERIKTAFVTAAQSFRIVDFGLFA